MTQLHGLIGGGFVIAVPSTLVRALGGDAACALLMAQYWFWSEAGTVEFVRSGRQITRDLGLSWERQRRARERLVHLGWLGERVETRRGKPALVQWVNADRLVATLSPTSDFPRHPPPGKP